MSSNPAMANTESSQKYFESFCSKLFILADKRDRDGKTDKYVVKYLVEMMNDLFIYYLWLT